MNQTEYRYVKNARKDHQCSWCGESIPKGSEYTRYRWYDSRDAGTCKLHLECKVAMEAASDLIRDTVYFEPGDNPRGCYCNYFEDCDHNMEDINA